MKQVERHGLPVHTSPFNTASMSCSHYADTSIQSMSSYVWPPDVATNDRGYPYYTLQPTKLRILLHIIHPSNEARLFFFARVALLHLSRRGHLNCLMSLTKVYVAIGWLMSKGVLFLLDIM